MAYLGSIPATQYSRMAKQTITGNGGAVYTLDYAVGSEAEIEVFVNNVRQEPVAAYSVAGTTLTMTDNILSSDSFYVVFQGKAISTGNIPEKDNSGNYNFDNSTLFVDAANNSVGIGTTSNVASVGKLSIVHNNTAITLGQSSASGEAAINFWSEAIPSRAASNAFTLGMDSLSNGGPSAFIWNRNESFLKFGTNNLERMRVDATGNVGISTSNPTARLEVRGGNGAGGISGPTSNTWAAKIIMNQDDPGLNGLSVQNRWGGTNAIIFEAARGWNGSSAGYYPALTVDGAGYVRTPLQPFFYGYMYSVTKTANWASIPAFDNVVTNRGSHYNTSTKLFTCPVSGEYEISVGGFISTGGDGERVALAFKKNGADYIIGGGQLSAVDTPFPWNRVVISCSTNDTICMDAMYSPNSIVLGAGAGFYSFGCIIRLLG